MESKKSGTEVELEIINSNSTNFYIGHSGFINIVCNGQGILIRFDDEIER